jgi:hypothetical protein
MKIIRGIFNNIMVLLLAAHMRNVYIVESEFIGRDDLIFVRHSVAGTSGSVVG